MIWLILVIIVCTVVIVANNKNKAKNEQNITGNVASTRYIQLEHEWLSWLENSQYNMRRDIIKLLDKKTLTNTQKLEELKAIIKKHEKEYGEKRDKKHQEQDVALAESHARGLSPENEEIDRLNYGNRKEEWWKKESVEYRKLVKPFLSKLDEEEIRSISVL